MTGLLIVLNSVLHHVEYATYTDTQPLPLYNGFHKGG